MITVLISVYPRGIIIIFIVCFSLSKQKQVKVVQLLIRCGATYHKSMAVVDAAMRGDYETLLDLLQNVYLEVDDSDEEM